MALTLRLPGQHLCGVPVQPSVLASDVGTSWRQSSGLSVPASSRSTFFHGGSHVSCSSSSSTRGAEANHGMPAVRAATGFGQKVAQAKPRKIRTLDLKKAGPTDRYKLFVRKSSEAEGGSGGKWEPLADLWVEAGGEAEAAVRERKEKLQEAAVQLYPTLTMRSGESIEFGIYKLVLPSGAGEVASEGGAGKEEAKQVEVKLEEVVLVALEGEEPKVSVSAFLRIDAGAKRGPFIPGFAW